MNNFSLKSIKKKNTVFNKIQKIFIKILKITYNIKKLLIMVIEKTFDEQFF